jgi:hypothetical protein
MAWRAGRLIRTPYGIAVLAVAIAGGVHLSLEKILSGQASHIFFVPAILVASALGGWGPGHCGIFMVLRCRNPQVLSSRALSVQEVR